uniref:Magnesium chelatase ChlI subunit:AAA ATPase n=1 Tax=uncultured bacterium contig00059 TaxID=1181542 RepID=A0A0A6ZH69_9BACT|nr:magnesium chelatase ChlI subunit:AAA ATPase [uncultured bacterium contig00059]
MDSQIKQSIDLLINNIKRLISVDTKKLEYIIAAQIAGGHVILADSHGVGKTSLARALAQSINWRPEDMNVAGDANNGNVKMEGFSRIQCTVDLLPQDILGYNRFLGNSGELIFNKGPIFAHFVLCDEINLLTPKTQGSFFQVMEEQSVTIEGKSFKLHDPFFIIATMNLKGVHLFPLPVPQLDRFMIRLSIGYPSEKDEKEIINKHGRIDAWDNFQSVISSADLIRWRKMVDEVQMHDDVTSYLVNCVRQTRVHPDIETPASPRAGVRISRLARSLALCRGMDYVGVDIIKEIFIHAMAHRIITRDPSIPPEAPLESILKSVPVEPKREKS